MNSIILEFFSNLNNPVLALLSPNPSLVTTWLLDFGCKREVWESGWVLSIKVGIKLELCRQEQRMRLLSSCLPLLYRDDNGSFWGYIKVYLSMFAEHFGILEQGALRLVINGLPRTGMCLKHVPVLKF